MTTKYRKRHSRRVDGFLVEQEPAPKFLLGTLALSLSRAFRGPPAPLSRSSGLLCGGAFRAVNIVFALAVARWSAASVDRGTTNSTNNNKHHHRCYNSKIKKKV